MRIPFPDWNVRVKSPNPEQRPLLASVDTFWCDAARRIFVRTLACYYPCKTLSLKNVATFIRPKFNQISAVILFNTSRLIFEWYTLLPLVLHIPSDIYLNMISVFRCFPLLVTVGEDLRRSITWWISSSWHALILHVYHCLIAEKHLKCWANDWKHTVVAVLWPHSQ